MIGGGGGERRLSENLQTLKNVQLTKERRKLKLLILLKNLWDEKLIYELC